MTTKPTGADIPSDHVHRDGDGHAPACPDGPRPMRDDSDRVVLRPGDALWEFVNAPLSPETVERIARRERSSARALARAGEILLD